MATKHFDCPECSATGKIVFKEGDFLATEIQICPFCGGDIRGEEDEEESEED